MGSMGVPGYSKYLWEVIYPDQLLPYTDESSAIVNRFRKHLT